MAKILSFLIWGGALCASADIQTPLTTETLDALAHAGIRLTFHVNMEVIPQPHSQFFREFSQSAKLLRKWTTLTPIRPKQRVVIDEEF